MDLRKVIVGDPDLQRKRTISNHNAVSMWVDEFTCEGNCAWVTRTMGNKPTFGISKLEGKISNRWVVDGHRGLVNAAS